MNNPWLGIPLDDYEGHMTCPEVGQAKMLADEFARAVSETVPASIALVGSAAGNGLDCLAGRSLERVLCIDVNPEYTATLEARHCDAVPGLACHVGEIETLAGAEPVDLAFAGLLFEYTRLPEALDSLARLVRAGGFLQAVLQLPTDNPAAFVTPSPHAEVIGQLDGFFQFVPPKPFFWNRLPVWVLRCWNSERSR